MKLDLVLRFLYSFENYLFFFEEDISREFSDFDFVVTDFDPNRARRITQQEETLTR